MGPMGPVLNFCSLGFFSVPLGSVLILLEFNSMCPWGSYSIYILGSSSVLSPIDIFKFLLRTREWVKLYIILATQSIKA